MAEKYLLTTSETEELLEEGATGLLARDFPLRYERSKQFMFKEDALRCLAGGILMNSVLGINESMLAYGQFGKPYIREDTEINIESAEINSEFVEFNSSPHFNISHSGKYVVMATAGGPVGIDIEKIDPNHADLAEHVFTEEELQWMNDDLDRFYALWTLKESLMKATGLGLNLPPKSFSVLDGIRDGLLLHDGMAYEMHYEKMDEYFIATCIQI